MNVMEYLNSRFGLTRRHRSVFDRSAPSGVNYFFCLGGITFALFLAQAATGLLLSMSYIPSETEAYQSIQRLHASGAGLMLRSFHHWAANLMVVTVVLHMLRVFVTGSYKSPRELNWLAGAMLLLLTLGFGFTGYLLPWDQKAYWATVVGTNMLASVPLVGPALASFLKGGTDVSGQTLVRFYSVHALWLPILTALFLWIHFHVLRRVGLSRSL